MNTAKKAEKLSSSNAAEQYYTATQWQLMRRKFTKHKLAISASIILIFLYTVSIFCEFFAPYNTAERFTDYSYHPPQKIHFVDSEGKFSLRPFVYGITTGSDPVTWANVYEEDKTVKYPVKFFVRGSDYKLLGIFKSNIRLFRVEEPGVLLLFGTDQIGRDVFSRNLYASRISLSVGLMGVAFSFVLGLIMGGISGYYGGTADMIVQRIIELLLSIPTIPLWMSLSAALPDDWPPIRIYFFITIILSIVGWSGLARVIRGKLLELREEDFVMAARISAARDSQIVTRHLLPSFISYLIVSLTLSVPAMILGETALSFLGLGIRAPAVSWGVMLKDGQTVQTVARHPWLLMPGLFVIVAVLAFNFLGDGLRDAADPYK